MSTMDAEMSEPVEGVTEPEKPADPLDERRAAIRAALRAYLLAGGIMNVEETTEKAMQAVSDVGRYGQGLTPKAHKLLADIVPWKN